MRTLLSPERISGSCPSFWWPKVTSKTHHQTVNRPPVAATKAAAVLSLRTVTLAARSSHCRSCSGVGRSGFGSTLCQARGDGPRTATTRLWSSEKPRTKPLASSCSRISGLFSSADSQPMIMWDEFSLHNRKRMLRVASRLRMWRVG